MKKVFFTIITLVIFGTFSANAQKIGFCQIDQIVQIMPEYEQAKAKLEGEVKDIQDQAEEMQVEFNNKYKAYNDNVALAAGSANKWSDAILQVKEQELQQLNNVFKIFNKLLNKQFKNVRVNYYNLFLIKLILLLM